MFSGMFNTTHLASKSFTTLRLLYKFCNENMRKSIFSDTDFDILKIDSFGSEELIRLYTNVLKSQTFDGDMSFKPVNFPNSIQMKQLYKIHKIWRHRRLFLNRFRFFFKRPDFDLGLFFHIEIWRFYLTADEKANEYYAP